MINSVILSGVVVATGATIASAQPMHRHRMYVHTHHVLANGRCNGVSYGTGQRGCGTATGGPVSGLTNRN